jgi:hypothetical protein
LKQPTRGRRLAESIGASLVIAAALLCFYAHFWLFDRAFNGVLNVDREPLP